MSLPCPRFPIVYIFLLGLTHFPGRRGFKPRLQPDNRQYSAILRKSCLYYFVLQRIGRVDINDHFNSVRFKCLWRFVS